MHAVGEDFAWGRRADKYAFHSAIICEGQGKSTVLVVKKWLGT